MRDGAIIEKELSCPGLLQNEDYELFFAWQDGRGQEIKRQLMEIKDIKFSADDNIIIIRKEITRIAKQNLEKKVAMKVAGKISLKLAGKVIAKLVLGFVPLLGAAAAGGINYAMLSSLHNSSINYFREKADIVCKK